MPNVSPNSCRSTSPPADKLSRSVIAAGASMTSPKGTPTLPPAISPAGRRASVSPVGALLSDSIHTTPIAKLTAKRSFSVLGSMSRSDRLGGDDDDDGDSSELVQHINALRQAMTDDMEHHVQQRVSSAQPLDREARAHAIDYSMLRDLRSVFSSVRGDAEIEGIPEDEFIRVFGDAIGGCASEEVLRAWCRKLDARCAGVLSWKDISTYLVRSASTDTWLTRHCNPALRAHASSLSAASFSKSLSGAFVAPAEETVMEWQRDLSDRQLEGHSFQSKAHNECISKLLSLPHVGSIVSASNDGSLRLWDQHTLEGAERPFHVANEWIAGLVKVSGVNRIAVLHSDRSIFFYNVFQSSAKGALAPRTPVVEYYRGFAQDSVFVQPQQPIGQMMMHASVSKKRVPGEAPDRPPLPVSRIVHKKTAATALCHTQSTPVVETVLLGNSNGSLEMLGLRFGIAYDSVVPSIFDISVHRGPISHIMAAPELQGVITSGAADGKVVVTNVEHLVSTQSMYSEIEVRHAKKIAQFDYAASYHHMLVHGYGRNIFIWNALTGVRNHTIPDVERVVLSCTLQAARHRLYALTEGKTIRVYDTRMWKCIDSVSDDRFRVPVDHFESVVFHESTSMVVTGACNLVAWRTEEAQRAIEDNAGKSSGAKSAQIRDPADAPLLILMHLPHLAQLVTMDASNVHVWSTVSNRRVIRWPWAHPSVIMCAAVSHNGRKVMVGADDGTVRFVSLGTGALCWALLHDAIAATGTGNEVSACHLAMHSPVPGMSLCLASIGRSIFSWLVNDALPINPTSHNKTVAVWRTLLLPVEYGIVHSFCVTGPEDTCFLAATNSGTVVAFNANVVRLYTIEPPNQIAAEMLHSCCATLACVTYSNGLVMFVLADCGHYVVQHAPVHGAYSKDDAVTAIASAAVGTLRHNPRSHFIALGDCGGYVSILAVGDGRGNKALSVRLLATWRAHEGAVTGLAFSYRSHEGPGYEHSGAFAHAPRGTPRATQELPDTFSLYSSGVDGCIVEWSVAWSRVPQVFGGGPPVVNRNDAVVPSRTERSSVAFVDDVVVLESEDDDDGTDSGGDCDTSAAIRGNEHGAFAEGVVGLAAAATTTTAAPLPSSHPTVVKTIRRRSSTQQPPVVAVCTIDQVRFVATLGGSNAQQPPSAGLDVSSSHHFHKSMLNNTTVGLRGAKHLADATRIGPMTRRFLSFSNLLAPVDRDILFEGSSLGLGGRDAGRTGSPASSPLLTKRTSSFNLKAGLSPNGGERTKSPTHETTPLSKSSKRYTLSSPSSLGDQSFFVDELRRPLSRVSALRRICGGGGDGGDEDGPSSSVEKRLHTVQRRREEREGTESELGYHPYFGRIALQKFDGEE